MEVSKWNVDRQVEIWRNEYKWLVLCKRDDSQCRTYLYYENVSLSHCLDNVLCLNSTMVGEPRLDNYHKITVCRGDDAFKFAIKNFPEEFI